jgi:hypothetical protein
MKINQLLSSEEQIEHCDNERCRYKLTKLESIIMKPFPKVFFMNFNWSNDDAKAKDLLSVYLSLNDGL